MIEALLNFDFMRYSLLSGILIGFIAPLIGAFIVVRRLSLIADAFKSRHTRRYFVWNVYYYLITSISIYKPYVVWYNLCNSWSFTYRKIKNFIFKLSRNCNSNYNECRNCNKQFFISADGFNQEIVGLLFGSISAVNLSDLITITIISIVVLLFILFIIQRIIYFIF